MVTSVQQLTAFPWKIVRVFAWRRRRSAGPSVTIWATVVVWPLLTFGVIQDWQHLLSTARSTIIITASMKVGCVYFRNWGGNIVKAVAYHCSKASNNVTQKTYNAPLPIGPWASCQIRKIAGCACAGNSGTFLLPPRVSDPDMHHGTCVTPSSWLTRDSAYNDHHTCISVQ